MKSSNTRTYSRAPGRGGFTIIELIVVLTVMTVLLSVIGLSLVGGERSAGVHSGQRTMSALISGARSQAVMKQNSMLILVSIDRDDPDSYLRTVQVARQGILLDDDGNPEMDGDDTIPNYIRMGSPTQLARGVFIVPPEVVVDDIEAVFGEYEDTSGERKSNGEVDTIFVDGEEEEVLYFRFSSRGFVSGSGYRLVLAPGRREQNNVSFDNSDQAVGFLIRPFGSVTLISDPRGFES